VWRLSCRYEEKPDRDAELRQELTELAQQRPRFGYRRLGILLARNGRRVNHKRLFRVYGEAGLSVKRMRRRRLVRTGLSGCVLTAPNEEWSLDFVCDAIAGGRSVRVLSVVDNFTRECLALETIPPLPVNASTSILDGILERRGCPKALRMDNGPEITSRGPLWGATPCGNDARELRKSLLQCPVAYLVQKYKILLGL
jgi:putative transposase